MDLGHDELRVQCVFKQGLSDDGVKGGVLKRNLVSVAQQESSRRRENVGFDPIDARIAERCSQPLANRCTPKDEDPWTMILSKSLLDEPPVVIR